MLHHKESVGSYISMESSLCQLSAATDLSWHMVLNWPEHNLQNIAVETAGSHALESAHLDIEVRARGHRHSYLTRLSLPGVTLPAGCISQSSVWTAWAPASGDLIPRKVGVGSLLAQPEQARTG